MRIGGDEVEVQPSAIPRLPSMQSAMPSGAAQRRKRVKVGLGRCVAPFGFAGLQQPELVHFSPQALLSRGHQEA
jgi:hypothetical protein